MTVEKIFRKVPDHPHHKDWDHCDGWPWIQKHLAPLFDVDSTVIFDDAVERTLGLPVDWSIFQNSSQCDTWFGVCHLPADRPLRYQWCNPLGHWSKCTGAIQDRWFAAREKCSFLIAMSESQIPHLEKWGLCPVVPIRHPTRLDVPKWDPDKLKRRLVQTGWYLRDTSQIYTMRVPPGYEKHRLLEHQYPWQRNAHHHCLEHNRDCPRPPRVQEHGWIPNAEYNELVASSVIFAHYLGVTATNTVVECIAREAPILLNRKPALEEYLGTGYPLFYDDIKEAPELLQRDRIMAAHEYLKAMDKHWLNVEYFAKCIIDACYKYIPAVRARLDVQGWAS